MIDSIHYTPDSASGVICHVCRDQPARHKIEEVLPDAPEDANSLDELLALPFYFRRHPYTAYLCCNCFSRVMGRAAAAVCGV